MKKSITRDEWSTLILIFAILLGTFIRFNPAFLAGFAINDGGMFAVMVDDLKASHYLLPVFTTYNHLNIPFAYPPLGFYLGRITGDLFRMDTIQVMRWVPAFFASLSIPAFYLLALRLFKNKSYAVLSTLVFALTPRAMSLYVMGGGLTRSPGQFFMLLAFVSAVRLYEEDRRADIFWTGLFGGLAVLSHPEAAVFTVVSIVFLWFSLSRKRIGFVHLVFVGILVCLVAAPWWVTVIHYHGMGPFLDAAATGQKTLAVFHLLFFAFTEEPYATLVAILGLIGIASRLIRRDYLLPLWLTLPFLVVGRGAPGPATIPLAMLSAVGFLDIILPALMWSMEKMHTKTGLTENVSNIERNIIFYLMFYLVFSTYQFDLKLAGVTIYPPDMDAMNWVTGNTPEDSRFLVLTGTTSVSYDPVLEWFPALTDRESIYTVQGTEWTKGRDFNEYVSSTYDVQECLLNGDRDCLEKVAGDLGYDYIYLSKTLRTDNFQQLNPPKTFPYFLQSMKTQTQFDVVYETPDVIVWKKNQ